MKNKIQVIFLCWLLLISLTGAAQICGGTINTVWQDDFGHGNPQLSTQPSPNITSGYTYENFGVNPGHYSLVNKFDYFPSWHLVPQDRTPLDSGGYFLVIDGNSSAPIFYETIVRDICPFRQYSFSTYAMNIDLPAFPSNQTFTFIISDTLGNQLATWDSPPISTSDTPVWVQMGFSFTSSNNTALKLQARFNQTGFDDFAFDDFQFSVCGPTLAITTPVASNTCADSIPLFSLLGSGYANPVYQWKKKNTLGLFEIIPGATSANYVDMLPADSNTYSVTVGDGSFNCPIIETKQINVKAKKRTTISNTICRGASFEGYSAPGTYVDTFATAGGCDSIRTLVLTVNNCPTALSCNNWLRIPQFGSTDYFSIGDLDVPGNKITVEASFYLDVTLPFIYPLISFYLVSKLSSLTDCNYALQPNRFLLSTTVGAYQFTSCDYQLKKINHVAMVYDGSTVKFYRNGYLLNSQPASGNVVTNDLVAEIGKYGFGSLALSMDPYINEVRIWNIARTESEIQTFMNASLPNPTTQPGLVAYYTFDNLNNKQGNAVWNGTLNGIASINNTVPDCTFTADFCNTITQQQSCNGSLGAAVVNIDFGSGPTNPGPQLSVAVPGASTNYNFASYATGNPPSAAIDGDYALVNAVPVNGAWHTGAKDHTGNANGYMAFFNSAPTPGEFYRQTVTNLCPGTTYEFAAWVVNVINASVLPGAILPNITFNILDPTTQAVMATYNTGDIPHFNTMTWNQYSFLFLLPAGNNSVTLVLANNNIGGNAQPGNDLAIDDITFRPCGPLTNASFSNSTQVDSTGITGCSSVNLFGLISGSFNSPSYQWQLSNDGGAIYTDIAGANTLNPVINNLANGQYIIRLLSAEAGNISSSNCRFISNTIKLSVTGCNTSTAISNIINDYAAVTAFNSCTNKLLVDDASRYNIGDTVLLIQMKGAAIDSSNTTSFGTITSYNNAGNYEFNYIKSKTGNELELTNLLLYDYDIAFGKVQLIRVPYFQTALITDTLTCLPWDGSKGGVVVLNSATAITLNAPIDASSKGFRSGQVGSGYTCSSNSWAGSAGTGGNKGEGITEYIPGQEAGGSKLANGGGGAFSANTGAGGGANYGNGGIGGEQFNTCSDRKQSFGGDPLDYGTKTRIFMGGGGGGGQQDNGQPVAPGGAGGGIIILKAASLTSNNQTITANGENITTLVRDEGGAGGGAGGTVLLYVNNFSGNLSIENRGGDGSSNFNQIYPAGCHGPGGGGGGGFVGFSTAFIPSGISSNSNGGQPGIILNPASVCFNSTHGAGAGNEGGMGFNFSFPASTIVFKKNIDSVKINYRITGCKSFDFNAISFVNSSPIRAWEWNFGDGVASTLEDVSHWYDRAGSYYVTLIVTDENGCQDSAAVSIRANGINFDLTFEQDVCNPRSVRFTAIGDTTADIFWSLGDGTIINNIRNPAHVFADTGYYVVQYSTGNGTCVDTIKKSILISFQHADIVLTPDTIICFNTNKILRSSIDSTLRFCWSPANFLNNPAFANPTTSTPSAITYTLLATAAENNLVTNGDFSNGNTGFTSGYFPRQSLPLTTGSYTIAPTSLNTGPATADCIDHNNPPGNMMVIWGDNNATEVWKQTVTVSPNTNYIFKIWAQTVTVNNFLTIKLSINGNIAVDTLSPSVPPCDWKQFTTVWNSGENTSATLGVLSRPHADNNDYFALDDISFSSYSIKRDSVIITVDTPFIKTRPDTTVCQSSPVVLNTTGAITYSWTPAAGLSNAAISNPVATPDTTTQYFVSGTNASGCTASDSLTVTVNPKPIITLTGNGDTLVCRNTAVPLFATGGVAYLWLPANTLNNPNIPNPVATALTDIVYFVRVTGVNNCVNNDSVRVAVKPLPAFSVSPNQSGCQGTSTQLNAGGGNFYLWSPASLVSDPGISNPVANTGSTTVYTVIIKESTCNDSASLTTTLTMLPLPAIVAGKSNDINCSLGSTVLTASGGLQYTWSPASGLSDINDASPIASPVNTTLYTVKGIDSNGCSNTDAVTVLVDLTGKATYLMPNAFSPNGDGRNDCYRVKYFGLIQELQLVIYNRFGNMVFYTSNPNECWDGNYKGNPAESGNYVYYIKATTACGPVEKKGNLVLVR